MIGEIDLATLLRTMQPVLHEDKYVFIRDEDANFYEKISPIMTFLEDEGRTLVIEKQVADRHSVRYSSVWKLITLTVHSNLEAVGFIAAVTTALAKSGISTNVVSAFYHDHIFVPESRAQDAFRILISLSDGQQ